MEALLFVLFVSWVTVGSGPFYMNDYSSKGVLVNYKHGRSNKLQFAFLSFCCGPIAWVHCFIKLVYEALESK
jgi:hypothetical protein